MDIDRKELKKTIEDGIVDAGYVFLPNEMKKLTDTISNKIINYSRKIDRKYNKKND